MAIWLLKNYEESIFLHAVRMWPCRRLRTQLLKQLYKLSLLSALLDFSTTNACYYCRTASIPFCHMA